jgi:hypothetical protein
LLAYRLTEQAVQNELEMLASYVRVQVAMDRGGRPMGAPLLLDRFSVPPDKVLPN